MFIIARKLSGKGRDWNGIAYFAFMICDFLIKRVIPATNRVASPLASQALYRLELCAALLNMACIPVKINQNKCRYKIHYTFTRYLLIVPSLTTILFYHITTTCYAGKCTIALPKGGI
jgi:hypothetical protein